MILRVSSLSRPADVAGAVAGELRTHRAATVQAVGAGAVNQAVKALILARQFVAADGIDAVIRPSFQQVDAGGQERTAVTFEVTHGNH